MTAYKFTCAHRDCMKQASHHLEIRVWPKGQPKLKHNFFSATWSLLLCHKHALTAKVDDVVTDECWGAINAACHSRSKAVPERSTLEIKAVKGMPSNYRDMLRKAMN